MSSPTRRNLEAAEVKALLTATLGAGVTDCGPLSGGFFAAVWRATLDDGRQVVLKVGPPPETPVLTYEHGLIEAEAEYFRLVGSQAAGVPVPEVLRTGPGWMVTAYLPGTPLPELPEAVGDKVRHELGTALAAVHRISGPRFGYSGDRPHGSTWSEAFGAIIDSLLSDAAQWDVALPGGIRAAVARHSDVLDRVQRPSLVHFDLWDGNVLATEDGRLTGLVDGERWLYADAAMDLVSPVLLRRIEDLPNHPLLHGYAESTGSPIDFTEELRVRLTLYRLHLYLVMLAEIPSRTGGAEADEAGLAWRTRLRTLLAEELSAL